MSRRVRFLVIVQLGTTAFILVLASEFLPVPDLAQVSQVAPEVCEHPAIGPVLHQQYEFIAEARADLWLYIDVIVDLHEATFRWAWTHPDEAQHIWQGVLQERGLEDLRPLQPRW